MREPRRRSPESSRRRRADRRHSREQLAAAAAAAVVAAPTHQPSQASLRSRADSSTSASSSTSSSLLNISRKSRFGIRSFFTRASSKKRVRKRPSFRKSNSSSSSFDDDLAYGRGYISRSSLDRPPSHHQQHPQQPHAGHPVQHPQHAPHHQQYPHRPPNDEPLFGPDGRPRLDRAQTDEEIRRIGRQLSDLAKAQNDEDLWRIGKTRPGKAAKLMTAATVLSNFDRHGKHASGSRGIASSRPRESDDEDWESASDDESSSDGDVDSGLAYGSVPHLPNRYLPPSVAPLPGQPSIISEPPAEAIRPPDRKSSAVDPRLFGPVNSLHGYINTPCGYRPGELPPQRQPTLQEPILQTGSASMEARPMRQVYPVTTGDPNTFDAAASSSGVSIPQITRDSYGRPGPPSGYAPSAVSIPVSVPASQVSGEAAYYSRPAPVPIQAPIPRNPVSPHVLEKRHAAVERTGSPTRRSRRSSDGTSLVESVAPILAGAAGAAGVAVVADQLRKRDDGRDDLRDRDQKSIREGKRVQARDETSYDRRDEKRRDERPVDTRYEKRDVRDTRYEDVREPKYESRNDGRSRVESEVKYASVSETKDRREERRERSDRPEKRDERPYETRQEKTYTQREERVYDDRDQKVYDKREKTYEKREDRPSKRDDRPPERRDERAYEKREEKIYDKRDDDRSSRKSDEKSLAQSVASVAAPALIGAAGAAILADRKEKHDDKRESEARAREDREREERRIRDDREREERRLREQHEKELRDKEEKRRLEEERLEKEARKLREDNAWREEAERRVRAEREVRYKEERISQVARERAERDRALMLRQEKLAREERRKLEAEAGKQAPRDTSGDRRLKREDVTIVYDGDAARSVAATSVAASSVAAASVVAASAVAAGAVAASEKSSSSKSSKKRESKTSSNSLGPKQAEKIPGKLSKEERRAQRDETRRMLAEIQKELEREQERAKLHQEMLAKEQDVAKETPAESSKRASTTSSKGSKGPIDPFQFQVETDAFPTPIYGTTPQRPLTPAVVTAEPKFEEEDDSEDDIAKRKSRRDAYEEARRRARIRAGQDPDAPDTPDSPVNVRDGLPSSDEPDRKREAEPVRDPIQEEADRIYRAKKMEAKIVEEEIRSRSASPEPSVVGKWNEEVEEPVVRIVTPPEMKRAPKKSKYDGPNADVRIDNVIMPRDLDRYTAPITTFPGGPTLKPVFKSRDPSAERERPMLNLVLPTPRHTPSPEKQRDRQPTTDRKDVQVVTVGPPESDDEGSAKKKSVVPSEPSEPVNDDDAEREAKAVAAIRRAFQKPAKKGINWGMITGALAGASAAAAASKEEEKSREIPTDTGSKPTTEEKPAAQSEAQSKPEPAPAPEPSRVETISSPRALPVDLDDAPPPQVGPKPSSPIAASKEKSVAVEQEATPTPRDVFVDSKEFPASTADVTPAVVDEPSKSSSPEIKMPGAFGEDKDFIATVAAGLEHSGFDPNKVIEDPAFHRRDSPPGSNDDESFYKPPSAETVTDLGVDGPSTGSRGAKNVAPADDWETPTKSSKKERRKASKRQDSRDTETTSRSEPLPLIEDRPREVEPSDNVSRDVDATKDNEPERKLTKKEQRKRDKAAKALAQDEPETFAPPETKTSLDAGDDEWAETPSKKGKKGKKGKQQSVPDAPEESSRSVEAPAITDTPIVAEPEEEWATEEPKKSKKKSKRDSATYDDSSTTYSGPASEISVASSKKSKKGKRKGTKDDYTILEQNEPPDRPGESFQVIDREISSVVSDPISKRSNGSHADDADDGKSAVSVPTSFDRKRSGKQSDGESSFEIVTPTNGTFEHKDDSKMGKENGSNSFLASAGTFGAGVGTVGATVAAIATELSLPKATPASAEEEEEEQKANPQQHQRERSVSYGSQVVDPEIVVQRVIKPAIDPQFGDLLPLPPSEPGSPYLPLEDELPELPESRPDTPPEERRAATAKTHARRRSAFETPVKTRSETAVPIQFRLGGKSVPSLPAFFGGRTSSPGALSSPVPFQTCEITPGTPSGKNRSRPTSWDSSREIKPLYLIEKTSSSSLGAEFKQDQLPELPPSDPPSRESPAPESDDERRERNFDRGFARGLMIDIPAALEGMSEDVLGSQEATPRAATFATSLAEPAEIISAKDPGAVGLLEPAEIVPREPVAKESPDTPPAGMSSTEPIHVAEALATVPASLDGQNGPSTPEAASRGILVEEPGPDVSAPSAPVSDITTKETTPTSEPARQIDEDLSKLPALPDSPQVSSVQIPATEPLLSEKELSDLPPLPASRSSSLAADLPRFSEPETEKTATDLPPLPESRSSSLATDIPRIVTPSNDVPSLAEEQTLVASFSQQPASEIPESYEDLKASLKKQALSDSASHESERNNALFAAGAAAAAGGIVVAHMLQDDTPRDLGDIELDKSRLLAPQKAESVYSADDAFDNASTIAASEAPTTYSLLSGTTFLGRDESWSKTRESPRLDRFAFVPPQAKKTLAEATIPEIPAEQSESREGEEESEWAASGFSRRSKKGKGKSTEFAPADVKEEVHSLPAEERSLQRSTSTLKKGKKKKGKKEVTWTEPAEPEQIETTETRDFAQQETTPEPSTWDTATEEEPTTVSEPLPAEEDVPAAEVEVPTKAKKGKKAKKSKAKTVLDWESEDVSERPDAEPTVANVAEAGAGTSDTAEPLSSVAKSTEEVAAPAPATGDVVPQDAPAAEASGGEPTGGHHTVDDAKAEDQVQDRSAPAEDTPKQEKRGLISSGISMLPSISGVGSFFGLGKKQQAAPEKAEAEKESKESADDAAPMQVPPSLFASEESGQQQGAGPGGRIADVEPLQGLQQPPSHDKSLGDTTGGALDTAVSLPNERADAPGAPTADLTLAGEPVSTPTWTPEAVPELDLSDKQKHSDKDESTSGPVEQDDSTQQITGDTGGDDITVAEATSSASVSSPPEPDSMDWDQDTGSSKKKGKKGKNKRQATKDEPVEVLPAEDVVSEAQPAAVDEPAAEDLWAETSGKKGKKGKKDKKKKGAVAADEPEPEPEPTSQDEPAAEIVSEPTAPEPVAGDEEIAVEQAPDVAASKEPPAPEASESAPVEEPEDSWSAPTPKKGKKGKKDKKKVQATETPPVTLEAESAADSVPVEPKPVEDEPAVEAASEPRAVEAIVTEAASAPEVPAEPTVPQEPEALGLAHTTAEEPQDDPWAESAPKKGKKAKKDKKKKQGSLVIDGAEPAVAEPPAEASTQDLSPSDEVTTKDLVAEPAPTQEEPAPAEDAIASVVPDSLEDRPPAEDAPAEETTEDVWDAPATKTSKKDKKKKKQTSFVAEEPQVQPEIETPAEAATSEEPSATDDQPAVERLPEPETAAVLPEAGPDQVAETPSAIEEPAEDVGAAESASKKSKKDKKKKKQASLVIEESTPSAPEAVAAEEPPSADGPSSTDLADTPELSAPTEAPESAVAAPAEDPWAETSSKKSKKDKKKKKQATRELDDAPAAEVEEAVPEQSPLTLTEEPEKIPDIAPTELAAETAEAAGEDVIAVSAEPAVDEPTVSVGKKGKKDKKKKKQSVSDAGSPAAEAPVEEPALETAPTPDDEVAKTDVAAEVPVADEPAQVEVPVESTPVEPSAAESFLTEPATREPELEAAPAEPSQDDTWAEPSSGKRGKKNKKRKDSAQTTLPIPTSTEETVEPKTEESAASTETALPQADADTGAQTEEAKEVIEAPATGKKSKKDKKRKGSKISLPEEPAIEEAERSLDPSTSAAEDPTSVSELPPQLEPATAEELKTEMNTPVLTEEPGLLSEEAPKAVTSPGPEAITRDFGVSSVTRTKKDKKKKRQSVSFADPLEEHREHPGEFEDPAISSLDDESPTRTPSGEEVEQTLPEPGTTERALDSIAESLDRYTFSEGSTGTQPQQEPLEQAAAQSKESPMAPVEPEASLESNSPEDADDDFAFTSKKSKKDKKKKRKSQLDSETQPMAEPVDAGAHIGDGGESSAASGEHAPLEGTTESVTSGAVTAEPEPMGSRDDAAPIDESADAEASSSKKAKKDKKKRRSKTQDSIDLESPAAEQTVLEQTAVVAEPEPNADAKAASEPEGEPDLHPEAATPVPPPADEKEAEISLAAEPTKSLDDAPIDSSNEPQPDVLQVDTSIADENPDAVEPESESREMSPSSQGDGTSTPYSIRKAKKSGEKKKKKAVSPKTDVECDPWPTKSPELTSTTLAALPVHDDIPFEAREIERRLIQLSTVEEETESQLSQVSSSKGKESDLARYLQQSRSIPSEPSRAGSVSQALSEDAKSVSTEVAASVDGVDAEGHAYSLRKGKKDKKKRRKGSLIDETWPGSEASADDFAETPTGPRGRSLEPVVRAQLPADEAEVAKQEPESVPPIESVEPVQPAETIEATPAAEQTEIPRSLSPVQADILEPVNDSVQDVVEDVAVAPLPTEPSQTQEPEPASIPEPDSAAQPVLEEPSQQEDSSDVFVSKKSKKDKKKKRGSQVIESPAEPSEPAETTPEKPDEVPVDASQQPDAEPADESAFEALPTKKSKKDKKKAKKAAKEEPEPEPAAEEPVTAVADEAATVDEPVTQEVTVAEPEAGEVSVPVQEPVVEEILTAEPEKPTEAETLREVETMPEFTPLQEAEQEPIKVEQSTEPSEEAIAEPSSQAEPAQAQEAGDADFEVPLSRKKSKKDKKKKKGAVQSESEPASGIATPTTEEPTTHFPTETREIEPVLVPESADVAPEEPATTEAEAVGNEAEADNLWGASAKKSKKGKKKKGFKVTDSEPASGTATPAIEESPVVTEEPATIVEDPAAVFAEPVTVAEEPVATIEEPVAVVEEPASVVQDEEHTPTETVDAVPDPAETIALETLETAPKELPSEDAQVEPEAQAEEVWDMPAKSRKGKKDKKRKGSKVADAETAAEAATLTVEEPSSLETMPETTPETTPETAPETTVTDLAESVSREPTASAAEDVQPVPETPAEEQTEDPWAPTTKSKKGKKDKKRKGSKIPDSETASGAATPVTEEAPAVVEEPAAVEESTPVVEEPVPSSTPDVDRDITEPAEAVIAEPAESVPVFEDVEPQPEAQADDLWEAPVKSKKGKKDKKRKGSKAPEPEQETATSTAEDTTVVDQEPAAVVDEPAPLDQISAPAESEPEPVREISEAGPSTVVVEEPTDTAEPSQSEALPEAQPEESWDLPVKKKGKKGKKAKGSKTLDSEVDSSGVATPIEQEPYTAVEEEPTVSEEAGPALERQIEAVTESPVEQPSAALDETPAAVEETSVEPETPQQEQADEWALPAKKTKKGKKGKSKLGEPEATTSAPVVEEAIPVREEPASMDVDESTAIPESQPPVEETWDVPVKKSKKDKKRKSKLIESDTASGTATPVTEEPTVLPDPLVEEQREAAAETTVEPEPAPESLAETVPAEAIETTEPAQRDAEPEATEEPSTKKSKKGKKRKGSKVAESEPASGSVTPAQELPDVLEQQVPEITEEPSAEVQETEPPTLEPEQPLAVESSEAPEVVIAAAASEDSTLPAADIQRATEDVPAADTEVAAPTAPQAADLDIPSPTPETLGAGAADEETPVIIPPEPPGTDPPPVIADTKEAATSQEPQELSREIADTVQTEQQVDETWDVPVKSKKGKKNKKIMGIKLQGPKADAEPSSGVVTPAVETETLPLADVVEPTATVAEEPDTSLPQEVQEEEWAPTKQSKKDKKRKGSKQVEPEPTPEPVTAETATDDTTAPDATVVERSIDVVPETVEPTAVVTEEPAAVPETPLQEDDWAPTKKSKKDKKRKGSKQVAQEPVSEPDIVETVAEDTGLPETPAAEKDVDTALDTTEATAPEAEPDAWAMPTKKSKKDKKKGKKTASQSDSGAATPAVVEAEEPIVTETAAQDDAALDVPTDLPADKEDLASESVEAPAEFAPDAGQAVPLEIPAEVTPEDTIIERSAPEQSTADQTEGDDSWAALANKKSKKDKRKGKKQTAEPESSWWAPVAKTSEEAVLPTTDEKAETITEEPTQQESITERAAPEPEVDESWALPTKKSKKGNKGKKQAEDDSWDAPAAPSTETPTVPESAPDTSAGPTEMTVPPTSDDQAETILEQPAPEEQVMESAAPEAEADDTWDLPAKKPKKGKKGKKQAEPDFDTVTPTAAPESILDVPAETPAETAADTSRELTVDETLAEGAKVDDWPEFTSKKSKKDKKKGKKADSASASGTQTPVVEDTVPQDSQAVVEGAPETADAERSVVFEPAKAKKDKKKRKSSAFAFDEPTITEQSPAGEQSLTHMVQSAEPQPISVVDDYFQPREPSREQEPIRTVELHPAVVLPPFGLGLIPDAPPLSPLEVASPKLLTSLQSPISAGDDDCTQPLVPITSPLSGEDSTPAATTFEHHIEHEPPFDYEAHRKKAKTRELDNIEIPEPVISAREIAASFLESESHKHHDHAGNADAEIHAAGPSRHEARELAASFLETGKHIDPVTEDSRAIQLEDDKPSRHESREIAAEFLEGTKHTDEPAQPAPMVDVSTSDVKPSRRESRELAASYLETTVHQPDVVSETIIQEAKRAASPILKTTEPPRSVSREMAASFLEGKPPSQLMDVDKSSEPIQKKGKGKKADRAAAREAAAAFLEKGTHSDKQDESDKVEEKSKSAEDDDDMAGAAVAAGALTGGVALLAQKFGGSTSKKKGKKQKKTVVDKRTARDDDMFDDPALWEGADRRPLEGSRMDENADGFWDVAADDKADAMEVDEKSADEKLTEVEQRGAPVVVEPMVVDEPVAVEKPVVAEESVREGKRSLDVDEPLQRGRSMERSVRAEEQVPLQRESMVERSEKMEDVEPSQREQPMEREVKMEDTMERTPDRTSKDSSRSVGLGRQDSETVPKAIREGRPMEESKRKGKQRERERSESPQPVQRAFSFPDDIADEEAFHTRDVKVDEKKTAEAGMIKLPRVSSISDFMRSVTSLAPVQEEVSSEDEPTKRESKTRKRESRGGPSTPNPNRDSGFGSGSPHVSRHLQTEPMRDSGVHLESTPRSGKRDSSTRYSGERERDRDSTRKAVGPETPRLREPSPPPHTPEPEKVGVRKKRAPEGATLTPASAVAAAAGAGAAVGAVAGVRSVSDSQSRPLTRTTPEPPVRRSASNTSLARLRTPEPLRPDSPGSLRSYTGTPPLRRVDRRVSGDLRSVSLSQRDLAAKAKPDSGPSIGAAAVIAGAAALGAVGAFSAAKSLAADNTATPSPVANEGRVRAKDMTDVYDGFGEGRIGSPRSPTRPHSMRRRQSMQVLELESRVDQLLAENRALAEARAQAESQLTQRNTSVVAERDNEIESLKRMLHEAQDVIERLKQTNEGLRSSTSAIAVKHHEEVRRLENQHAQTAKELELARAAASQHVATAQEKDATIASLRSELEEAKEEIRSLQEQILKTTTPDDGGDFLDLHDVDYFDHRCQQLCAHVQQWVLRFSKFSDMRACRLTSEINDEKLIDRLDNAVLDGSDVDTYLNDRVRRRDIFMSMTTTMIWEFVFTRYLFGMDREQRQKLKTLEKQLLDVGPPHAVRQWRAVTLTLLSRRPSFKKQRDQDTEAVVQAILDALGKILPPPSNLEDQIQTQLRRVVREAVGLAIEMRCQKAEYMMLPPLQPEYDEAGELTETVAFNAALMNERSGDAALSNEDLEAGGATVRVVLFPLVVRKGDENGVGEDEIVVCPAQVLVARPSSSPGRKRMMTPSSDAGGVSLFARSPGPGSTRGGGGGGQSVSALGAKSDVSMSGAGAGGI